MLSQGDNHSVKAAGMNFDLSGSFELANIPQLTINILSWCIFTNYLKSAEPYIYQKVALTLQLQIITGVWVIKSKGNGEIVFFESNDRSVLLFQEVEREISFRTEQGLYYSYFKQLINAPTWMEVSYWG